MDITDVDGGNPNRIENIVINNADVARQDFLIDQNLGSIGDKVFNDLNRNGIQERGELGVSGVTVTLLNGANNPTTVTDASGNYRFNNLVAGQYVVQFGTAPSGFTYTIQNQGSNEATDSDVNPTNRLSEPINLRAGENNRDVDAGIVQVPINQGGTFILNKSVVRVLNADGSVDSDGVIDTVGDKVEYRLTLTNSGFVAITAPTVNDPLLGGNLSGFTSNQNTDNVLGVGEVWTFDATYGVTANALSNLAASSGSGDPVAQITAELPDTVQARKYLPGTIYSLLGGTRDSFADTFIVSGSGGSNPDILDGWINSFCVDVDNPIAATLYTAKVFSSYEAIPTSTNPAQDFNVDRPENWDLVNWIINQDFIDKDAGGRLGKYTAGDVQFAIWSLIDDKTTAADLAPFNPARAQQLVNAAQQVGPVDNSVISYRPGYGDKLAILLTPIDAQGNVIRSQKSIVEYEIPAIGQLPNTATASATNVTSSTDSVSTPVSVTGAPKDITYTVLGRNVDGLGDFTSAGGQTTVVGEGRSFSLPGIASPTDTVAANFERPVIFDGVQSIDDLNPGSGAIFSATPEDNFFNLGAVGDGVNDIAGKFAGALLNNGDDTFITADSLNPLASNSPFGVRAGNGNDTVNGSGETNTAFDLRGEAGNDILLGGALGDIITGGAGQDTLTGNGGVDKFDYRQVADSTFPNFDRITDFKPTEDKFLVSTLPTNVFSKFVNAAFSESALASAFTPADFAKRGDAAVITFSGGGSGSRVFVAINGNSPGFSVGQDAIVEITGARGLLNIPSWFTVA